MRYKTRPITIEAIQFTTANTKYIGIRSEGNNKYSYEGKPIEIGNYIIRIGYKVIILTPNQLDILFEPVDGLHKLCNEDC